MSSFSRCPHHDLLPSIYGDFFLPVTGSFVIDARTDVLDDQSEAFFHHYDGRKVGSDLIDMKMSLVTCVLVRLYQIFQIFHFRS